MTEILTSMVYNWSLAFGALFLTVWLLHTLGD